MFCLEAFEKLDNVRVVAVADVRYDAAEQFAKRFGVPAYNNPADLIADPNVQIVHIATPPSSHHELVLATANAGKNVLCEKPLAMNPAQADEMLAAAAAASVIAPVNFVLRYNAVTRTVQKIVDSGVLGKPLSARLTNCASDSKLDPDHWFWAPEVSGGIFIEHGVHFFDLYSSWFGPGEVINANTELRENTKQEDRVMCTIRHENGVIASHYHSFDQFSLLDRTDHRIVCELGDIRIEGWIPLSVQIDAAVNDTGAETLRNICGGLDPVVKQQIPPSQQNGLSRGCQRDLTKIIHLDYTPNTDKQTVYGESVQQLLADQLAYLNDNQQDRVVTESNGRNALLLACAAVRLAEEQ